MPATPPEYSHGLVLTSGGEKSKALLHEALERCDTVSTLTCLLPGEPWTSPQAQLDAIRVGCKIRRIEDLRGVLRPLKTPLPPPGALALLLTTAYSFARDIEAEAIFVGTTWATPGGEWSPAFVAGFQDLMGESSKYVEFVTPLANTMPQGIADLAAKLDGSE